MLLAEFLKYMIAGVTNYLVTKAVTNICISPGLQGCLLQREKRKKEMKKTKENNSTELQLQTGPYRTTFVGTELLRPSTKGEWFNYGEILKRVDEAKQWAIGDWLKDGKRHYGDGLYQEAEEIVGMDIRSLQELKQIADKFKITERSVNLSWSHHKEVVSIKKLKEIKGKLILSDELVIDQSQLMKLKSIAERFEILLRSKNLDALRPDILQQKIRDAIESELDIETFNSEVREHNREFDELNNLREKVMKFMEVS